MKRCLFLLVAALALATSPAGAAPITLGQSVTAVSAGSIYPSGPGAYSGSLVNEAGLAYSNTYLLDMNQYGASQLSAQSFYSSDTIASPTVTDGHESSGTITVASYSSLSAAAATIQITVTTNSFAALPTLTFWNCSLTMGKDYSRGATRNATASNLATAITACNSSIAAAATANVVYATATAGSYANSYAFTSDNSSVTVSAATMSGGRDNAVLTINGTALTQGTNFSAVTSSAATAANLATAIAANTTLAATLSVSSNSGAAYGVIVLTSKFNGTAYNYAITSSTPTALTVKDGANLLGGADSGFALNSKKIVASASGMTLGIPFLYAIGSNPAIGGLTTGTTYYAVPAGGTSLFFAKYSTSAVAGLSSDYATVTSTNSGTTAHTYTLAPLAISGTPSFKWQVSNDNSNWDDLAVSSVTVSSYSIPPAVTSWSFGTLGYRYIRQNVVGPTTGGLYLNTTVLLNR
jgi:hypothetical protein